MNAIYILTERGRTQYAYSEHGGNYATPLVRLSEACVAASKHERRTLDALMELNYDGEYAPQDLSGNKVLNRLDDSILTNDTAYMLMRSGVVGSVIHINLDRNIIRYNYNNTLGKQDYVLDIDDATDALVTSVAKIKQEQGKWSIKDLSEDYLTISFDLIQQQGKSKDYIMDIVVVEPGTPAYAKRLDITENKLDAMQSVVQGLLEPLYSLEEQGIYVYGNDEARVLEQAPNRKIKGEQAICGTFFICGANEQTDSVSLTPEQIQKYTEKYKVPDRFTEKEIEAAHRCEVYFFPIGYPTPALTQEKQQTVKPKREESKGLKI